VALDLEKNPAMVAAEATVEEKRARIDLAKAERIPDVKVEALYRRLESREDSVDLGVAIPLPFFDRNQGRLREARAELAAAEARARATAVETGQRLSESHAQLVAALDQARVLRTGVLPLSQTIKTTMERRHQAGEISLAELLPARRDWAAVQLSYLETLRDVMAAWNEVRALTGTL
jgi:cobalt-zinc-cadmium efflux system outer membrane protein